MVHEKQTVLVVEDDEGLQRQLKWSLSEYDVVIAGNREEAVSLIRRHTPAVMTLDLGLPPDPANVSEGFATLNEVLSLAPSTKIIVITGNDDRENAVKAVAEGAYDFYAKPIDPDVLKIIIDRAIKVYNLEQENRILQKNHGTSPLDGFITNDDKMLGICRTIEKVAPTDVTTMLFGESGTGKEILARALHMLSNRAENNFISINCAAIPENLLESELFGHEPDAFDGATSQVIGKIELANGGTLFLDEIGDTSLPLQAKLLRLMQDKVIKRIGGRADIQIDVRIVSATHKDLKEMIQQDEFREDLYYRLSEVSVEIPPLRERKGDKVLLARSFIEKHASNLNKQVKGLTQSGVSAIENYAWPGNVRELESSIKRAIIMADTVRLSDADLGLVKGEQHSTSINLREVREQAEKEAIQHALNITMNNVSKTADLLGVSRPTLYDLMKKYNFK